MGASTGHPRYKKIEDLNSGGFGFVQLCRDRATGDKVNISLCPIINAIY